MYNFWLDANYDVDGDIILYENPEYPDDEYNDAVELVSRLWNKVDNHVIVPYTITKEASEFDRKQIHRAIAEFHHKTCIR